MRGLTLRIMLIVSGALALIVLVSIMALNWQRQANPGSRGVDAPLPEQTAAIVELIEATPADRLPLVLRALNSSVLHVEVVDKPPESEKTVSLPGVALAVKAYLGALGGRPVRAMIEADDDAATPALRWEAGRLTASRPIRLVIGLRDGRTAVIEARGVLQARLTGLRLSLLALAATIAIAVVSLWVLRRQLRPLERLAGALERFGTRLETSSLPVEGTREVRQLIAAFNGLQARIHDLVAGRTQMMASIGHDLRTYLTRLRLRAEFISDPEQRRRAERDIDDMHALMADTLTLAKLDHDTEPAETADLVALARRNVEGFAASGSPVRFHGPDTPVEAPLRPSILGRALSNLISNALKYGGEADVTVSRVQDMAEIRVEDRGPGIPAEEREAVLEPFYRRDAARNLDGGGFGLGLAIVADVVRHHHGLIALEDRPGGGLLVRIRLPLAGAAAA